jgi:hypothetical protein
MKVAGISARVRPLVVALAGLLGGCSGAPTLPPVQALSMAPSAAITETAEISEPPAEIYTRVARAANMCWFGPTGALSKAYVFYADTEQSETRAAADITIHERLVGEIRPWGLKAFRIAMTATGGITAVSTTNLKVPPDLAAHMHADVMAWSRGRDSCQVRDASPSTPNPTPQAATPAPSPAPATTPATAKPVSKPR